MKKGLLRALTLASCAMLATGFAAKAETESHHASGMASSTQDLTPPKQISMYLDGFHCYKNELGLPAEKQRQIHAMHYCSHHGNVFMCAVYDGNDADARLVAIEYVIGNEDYQKLAEKEKQYWHPHTEEVDTGLLRMPGLDPQTEKTTLTFLKTTWGKTFQLWPDLSNPLPVGEPQLLWAIDSKKINSETMAAKNKRDAQTNKVSATTAAPAN
ncbi:MAG TPA: DUF1264 domain-containing protein [Candidatus Obscuribacterales bacterium]